MDISTENDSFFCYPKNATDVVTKLAFATEILYQKHLEDSRAKRTAPKKDAEPIAEAKE